MGQVPALLEDGRILTENAAILLRLADLRPESGMAPAAGTRERYQMYGWLSWLASSFHVAHTPMFAPQRFVEDPAAHAELGARALRNVGEELAVIDRHLEGRQHILLDHQNLLDAYVFAMARWTESKLDHQRDFPEVARFLAAMREDEGVRSALAIDEGEKSSGGNLLGHVAFDALVSADGQLLAAP